MIVSDSLTDFMKNTNSLAGTLARIADASGLAQSVLKAQCIAKPAIMSTAAVAAWMDNMQLRNLQASLAVTAAVSGLGAVVNKYFSTIPFERLKAIDRVLGLQNDTIQSILAINRAVPRAIVEQRNLFNALKWQTERSINSAIRASDWELIDEIEGVNTDFSILAECLVTGRQWGEEGRTVFKRLMGRATKHGRLIRWGNIIGAIINFLVIVTHFQMYAAFVKAKPAVTMEDLIAVKAEILSHTDSVSARSENSRFVIQRCAVYLKPSAKSLKVGKLSVSDSVAVLQVHNKWLLVSYQNDQDGIMQTGWILKKHTN